MHSVVVPHGSSESKGKQGQEKFAPEQLRLAHSPFVNVKSVKLYMLQSKSYLFVAFTHDLHK